MWHLPAAAWSGRKNGASHAVTIDSTEASNSGFTCVMMDSKIGTLASALAPRIWELLKARARNEKPDADEAETIAYLASLGIVPKS